MAQFVTIIWCQLLTHQEISASSLDECTSKKSIKYSVFIYTYSTIHKSIKNSQKIDTNLKRIKTHIVAYVWVVL